MNSSPMAMKNRTSLPRAGSQRSSGISAGLWLQCFRSIWPWHNLWRAILGWMNIHMPAILMFIRVQSFDPQPFVCRPPCTVDSERLYYVAWSLLLSAKYQLKGYGMLQTKSNKEQKKVPSIIGSYGILRRLIATNLNCVDKLTWFMGGAKRRRLFCSGRIWGSFQLEPLLLPAKTAKRGAKTKYARMTQLSL